MNDTDQRYDRQTRLAEVGQLGQARLVSAQARVAESTGAQLESEYLQRAGLGVVRGNEAPTPFKHASFFTDPGCCEVAAGAWRALLEIRGVLQLDELG